MAAVEVHESQTKAASHGGEGDVGDYVEGLGEVHESEAH